MKEFKMHRHLILGLVVTCLGSVEGQACRGTFSESTIIFDDLPKSLDAPVAVEVTITDRSNVIDPSSGQEWAVMNARVDRIIRGLIDDKPLRIVTGLTDCSRIGGAGEHGIVVGTLRQNAQGGTELVAIQESNIDRGIRKAREQGK